MLILTAFAAPVPNTRLCVDVPAGASWNAKNTAFEFGNSSLTAWDMRPTPMDAVHLAASWTTAGFSVGPFEAAQADGVSALLAPLSKTTGTRVIEGYVLWLDHPDHSVQVIALEPVGQPPGLAALRAMALSVTTCAAALPLDWAITPPAGMTAQDVSNPGGRWAAPDGSSLALILMPPGAWSGVLAVLVAGGDPFGMGAITRVGVRRSSGAVTFQDVDIAGVRFLVAWSALDVNRTAVLLGGVQTTGSVDAWFPVFEATALSLRRLE